MKKTFALMLVITLFVTMVSPALASTISAEEIDAALLTRGCPAEVFA